MNLRITSLAAVFCVSLFAAEPAAPERELVFKDAKQEQIRHSMDGIRDTLIFYTFPDKSAVLVLRIDNTKDDLPVSATVHLFPPTTDAEALGKWVNNQHSDGLFIDAPEPTLSYKLPDGICATKERELIGKQKQPTGEDVFNDYKVKLTVKEHRAEGKFHLAAFAAEANVFVKIKTP